MSKGKSLALKGCLGCAGVVLLIVILIAVGIGALTYQGYQFTQELGQTYQEIGAGYSEVDQQNPFIPPDDYVLDKERVNAFLAIRTEVAISTSDTINKMKNAGKEIEGQFDQPGIGAKIKGIGKVKEMIKIATNIAAGIGQKHIQQLSSHNMSAKEYQWLITTYLGTLSKADKDENTSLHNLWTDYLENFEKSMKEVGDFQMNTGRNSIRGDDMNKEELLKAVEHVVFSPANAQIVIQNANHLFPTEQITILDFLALKLDKFTKMKPNQGLQMTPDTIPQELPQSIEVDQL